MKIESQAILRVLADLPEKAKIEKSIEATKELSISFKDLSFSISKTVIEMQHFVAMGLITEKEIHMIHEATMRGNEAIQETIKQRQLAISEWLKERSATNEAA